MTIGHIRWEIQSADQLLHQLSYFNSCKLYVENCTAVVPLNYCHFTVHVQIEQQLTISAVLSVPTTIRRHAVQKDQFIFILVFISL